jgi:hypothetical protein
MKSKVNVQMIIFFFCLQQLTAQNSSQAYSQLSYELDKVLSDQFKSEEPGCAALVAINGQIIYENAVGLADTRIHKGLKTETAFGIDYKTLNTYKQIHNLSKELASKGYKTEDGKDVKLISGFEINYGSRSSIPILSIRKTSNSEGFITRTIYIPDEDIFIITSMNSENNSTNDPTPSILNKVLTDVFGSLDFTDNTNIRLVFYHFLLTVKVLPQGGIIENGKKAHLFINGDTKYLHYTTDGREPDINSPTYNKNILLTKACELKIKIIPSAKSDTLKSVSFKYTEGSALEPIKSIKGLKPGLEYSYYEGIWNTLPDFHALKPRSNGITQIPDLSVALKKDSCAIQFNGYVFIDKDDMYNIYSVSDDGSKVFINDKLIVNNDGNHGSVPEAYLIPLKKGYYPIKILYFENSGGQELQVGYWTDGNKPKPFTKDILFHRE